MSVSSEVQQDYFLSSIGKDLFESEPEDDLEGESSDDYVETEFVISLPKNSTVNLPVSSIVLEHRLSSCVDLVGLQVWRGAFLLCDFILARPHLFRGRRVLELASGTGLTAITAAIVAKSVISTDVNRGEILGLLRRNGRRNESLITKKEGGGEYEVKEFDFFWNNWSTDVEQIVKISDIILAADVVYDREITKHFFKTLAKIMNQAPKVVYIAIEERKDVDNQGNVVSPNFKYFLEELEKLEALNTGVTVTKIETDFDQSFRYTRVLELTLWSVRSSGVV